MEDETQTLFIHQNLPFHTRDPEYEVTNLKANMLIKNTSGIDLPIPNRDCSALILPNLIYNMHAPVSLLYPVDPILVATIVTCST